MRSSLIRDVTQRRLIVIGVSGEPIVHIFEGKAVDSCTLENRKYRQYRKDSFTLEDRNDRLYRKDSFTLEDRNDRL